MIEIRQVSKVFGTMHAVRELSLEVRKGQCVGLLGPNGAGKTTTIRMITGFTPPSTGTILVAGHDTITESIQARGLIGYLPEATPLHPEMRVVDFLNYRAGLYGLDRYQRRRNLASAIELCRLGSHGGSPSVERKRIGHLSKGYRQRVGLAAALMHNPPVLLLDEPTSGLDPTQIRDTRSLIKDLAAKRTVIVSSHILPEVEKTCDRVVIMAGGRVLADGSPEELMLGAGAPAHVVEVAAAHLDRALEILRSLDVIDRADTSPPDRSEAVTPAFVRVSVRPKPVHHDVREPIASAFASAGVFYRELTRHASSLEQVFINVIESDDAAIGSKSQWRAGQ